MPNSIAKDENKETIAEPGIWFFILADLCLFGLYFWVFAWDKSQFPEQFAFGQSTLSTFYGGLNTIVLLTSSYFVARAVHAARQKQTAIFSFNLKLAMVCGLIFLIVKCIEYTEKFQAGFHIASNAFYRDYFTFTGFHMLHVIIGLGLLSYTLYANKHHDTLTDNIQFIEGSALYWHMVDLLWVVLFSLIYLAP